MTNIKYVVDSNVFYNNLAELGQLDLSTIVVSGAVLRELDKHKSLDGEIAFKSREATRFIKQHQELLNFDLTDYDAEEILGKEYSNDYADNRILACALNYGGIISGDLNVQLKGKGLNLDVIDLDDSTPLDEDVYRGFVKIELTQDEYRDFHDNKLNENIFNLLVNQYLIIFDKDTEPNEFGDKKPIQSFKWNGEYYVHIKNKVIKSGWLDDFKARDEYQACAIDSAIENKLTMLQGDAGTAKTQIAISLLLQQLYTNKIDRIVVFSNSVPVADAFYHGLVKGDLKSKLMQSGIGNILASKLGSYDAVEKMLITEQLMILPASDIRGFETGGIPTGVLITEGQNWVTKLLKLAIQRCTEQAIKVFVEGDRFAQLDIKSAIGNNSGMGRMSKVFRGQEYYGEIELQNIYRSEMARRAELMTDYNFN